MRTSDGANFILFSIFMGLLYGGWKILEKVIRRGTEELFPRKPKKDGGSVKTHKKEPRQGGSSKPFFVKSLTRRRRLDLNRKDDNILSGKLGKKLKKHRKGMFGQ